MDKYNFRLENTSTTSKTEIRCTDIQTIINVLKGFETKERNNTKDAEKIVAKKKKSKKSYTPKDIPNDNNNISNT